MNIETVTTTVADHFHVTTARLKSKDRKQHIAFVRQVAMHLCRELIVNSAGTPISFPEIGESFNRDHSTAIHSHNLIKRRLASGQIDDINAIKAKLVKSEEVLMKCPECGKIVNQPNSEAGEPEMCGEFQWQMRVTLTCDAWLGSSRGGVCGTTIAENHVYFKLNPTNGRIVV